MVRWPTVLVLAGGVVWCVLSSRAAGADGVTYEFLEGSVLVEACGPDCDRAPILREITGTCTIEALPPLIGAENFTVRDIRLRDAAGEYEVSGGGTYRRLVTYPPVQSMELSVAINARDDVVLACEADVVVRPWPLLEIEISEVDPKDPLRVYSLRIVAAPRPIAWRRHALLPGSEFLDECTICGKPSIPVPLTGSFLLGEIDGGANPVVTYIVRRIAFASETGDWRITGNGLYEQGGEVAVAQSMWLAVDINAFEFQNVLLAAERGPPPVRLPAIDVQLAHLNPETPVHVFSLRILAEPAEPEFRRGDVNGDGAINIADAVAALVFLLAGGPPPPCMDAADANDDGVLDISDGIRILMYLFAGGGPLPPPGEACGIDPTDDTLSCEKYPACS